MHFLYVLLLFSSLWSIEIDIDFIKKEIVRNPHDVNSRLVLARLYISKNNYDKAQKLLDEVLSVDHKNQKARFLTKDIKKLKQIESLVKSDTLAQSSKLTDYFKKLNHQKQYKYITLFGDVLIRNNIALSPEIDYYVIDSYIHLKNYNKAKKLFKKSSTTRQNREYLSAKIYEKQGQNSLSEQAYKSALESGDREDIVLGLYDLYMKQYKTKEAESLVDVYQEKNSKSSISKALLKRDKYFMNQRVETLKNRYEQKATYATLKEYFHALEGMGKKDRAVSVLTQYVNKNPKDETAVLFLANIHNWNHKPKLAIDAMNPIVNKTKNRDILKLYVEISSFR